MREILFRAKDEDDIKKHKKIMLEFKDDIKKHERCKSCKHIRSVRPKGGFSFFGCYHAPYNGKRVTEIEDCPKRKGAENE